MKTLLYVLGFTCLSALTLSLYACYRVERIRDARSTRFGNQVQLEEAAERELARLGREVEAIRKGSR